VDRKQDENAQIVHCREARTRELRAAEFVLARVASSSDRCRLALVTERLLPAHQTSFTAMRVSCVQIYLEENHQLESRMREICQSGSEGGGGREASPYP
jgi:hypothetical protein